VGTFALLDLDPDTMTRLNPDPHKNIAFDMDEERPEEAKDGLEQKHEVALEESPHLLHDRGEGSHVVPKQNMKISFS
jgi:hypothetical protein